MSLRGTKRACGIRGDEAGTSKRRRVESEDALWQLRPVSDLKMSSIYNRNASEAPAELFRVHRKDFISMMKLADSEPLTTNDYWIITDTWKQDWERGVQVPVNPDSLPAPKVNIIKNPKPPNFVEFKLPKDKYIHLSRDAHYQPDKHLISTTPTQAETACSYDLDATDTAWLKLLNAERARAGATAITEDQFEKVIEELEVRTWEKIQSIIKSEEGLGLEYDENVICDVCRSPDSEDGNEMVFCDECNICVHQACYGITVIPEGQWLCRPCRAGVKPNCVLCPNLSGAMKCTPSGHKWAHVSCVLWIPEVSIGCAEKMEPITKIGSIPQSRWSLVCVLCRERKGACIQCSVKTCKTAYHVTCAFKHGLEMRAIIEDENADDGVKLRSYCQKHSVNSKKEKCPGSGEEEEETKRKRRKDMTSEEKNQARAARLQEIEAEFDEHIGISDISTHPDVDQDTISYIYYYWKLKRRAGHNRPLLPPKSDNNELLTHRQEQADLEKMKKFVQLRQDLERVRNLCYMVSRREKLSRSYFRMREQTFHKQIAVLSIDTSVSTSELTAIIEANHGPSIYDRLYSGPNAPDHEKDFDDLLARIAPQVSREGKKRDRNGHLRRSKSSSNPYKKHYVNGSRSRGAMYSGLSSEESGTEIGRSSKYKGRAIGSSTDEDIKKPVASKKKVSPKGKLKKSPRKCEQKKKKLPRSKAIVESSSEDEVCIASSKTKKDQTRSKTLQQMEKEMTAGRMGVSGSDSDDLIQIRTTRNNKFPVDIYSDSSESLKDISKSEKIMADGSPTDTDSLQQLPRTKAAMKEFIPSHTTTQDKKTSDDIKPSPKKRGRKRIVKAKTVLDKSNETDEDAKNKENIKLSKQKDNPTDLIVPQRQAAKKASENMRSTTTSKKEESATVEKQSPKKTIEESKISKTAKEESSSSSSNSSSSSYSSSSSSDEVPEKEKPSIKPTAKAREIKPIPRPTSLFSPPGSRPTVDLPFLDKVSRPLSSTSASSDSDSSKGSRYSITRPRRRRKAKTIPVDESSHKDPDKKLKTSERKSECGTSSPTFEREKPLISNDTHPASCSRTRSSSSGGNIADKLDSRTRESSKDDSLTSSSNKVTEEINKSTELPTTERKTNEELIQTNEEKINTELLIKSDAECDSKMPSLENTTNVVETKVENVPKEEIKVEDLTQTSDKHPFSPIASNMSPVKETEDHFENSSLTTHENWISHAPSPHIHPPPVEKPGDHEKYMTEDKSLDADLTDRSSIKMIAKIQANLNENTMIKSPKTPMDARTILLDSIDTDNSIARNVKKRPLEKKFIIQDVSHVQGVEISKSAKIPSSVNTFPNRKVFSPQPRDSELYEIDIFTPYSEFMFKEDSKEQGVQETLNLVDRLRMQLSHKKAHSENPPDESFVSESKDFESDILGTDTCSRKPNHVSPIGISVASQNEDKKYLVKDQVNSLPKLIEPSTLTLPQQSPNRKTHTINLLSTSQSSQNSLLTDEKWQNSIAPLSDSLRDYSIDRKFDDTCSFSDDIKEPSTAQSDIRSISEIGDTISLSKQSDDSQSLSVVDHSVDNEFTQDNQPYENNNSMIHSDCATVSSPYISHETKWQESKITTRRSSASSTNSEGSLSSKTNLHINTCGSRQGGVIPEMEAYPPMPPYSHHVETALSLNQFANYPQSASPYLGPMALPLFAPGSCASAQLSLSSPGPGLFVPSLSYSATSLMPSLPKPNFSNLCAAFTSSSQNIALTTAMIASPTSKPIDSPSEDIDVTGSDKISIVTPSSPSLSVGSFNESNSMKDTKPNDVVDTHVNSHEVKSPLKPAKPIPAKLSGKSPGKSPKQSDLTKVTKKPSSRNNRSQRGRGRNKGRAHNFPVNDFMENSIQSKLVGTVYDFEEEIANDGVNLKALRERRKSLDIKDDRSRSDHSYKDPDSPHTSSPHQIKPEIKDSKSPPTETKTEPKSPTSKNSTENGGFTQVQAVLPGPVDMRTYNPMDAPQPAASDVYHSHLLAFASGTADQQLAEIDEEVEKQLHSALMASNPESESPGAPQVQNATEINKDSSIPVLPKVSLSDSRNQLKVKIKGPFLDANYSTSSSVPTAPKPPVPVHDTNSSILTVTTSSIPATGSTNLRRMRKKELLRQYWTQDMNMDDPSNNISVGIIPPPVAPQPLIRAVITIPKAVASMTSIPTREDYKMIDTPTVEKKKRKNTSLSRELRQLTKNSDIDITDNMKLSNYVAGLDQYPKRRTRIPIKSSPPHEIETSPVAPKLKIKIGSKLVQPVAEDTSGFQLRPPKKRLQAIIPKPTFEDLKRESMKYRRKVMADFQEVEKTKKQKKEKSKKKKDKKCDKEKLLVVNSESDNATKLIIKIKRHKDEDQKDDAGDSSSVPVPSAAPEPAADPFDYDPSAPDPLAIDPPFSDSTSALRRIRTEKVTPIRLKRSAEGSGYVMKKARLEKAAAQAAKSCASVPSAASPPTLEDKCAVR
ncbi:unnamed protein product [Leptidea sinapis]|uniref:PHD finger protein rhinoceros n=1 Tax=Leptidea sinapis TaxID=189913 RepID=A0A5E4Q962_9NEOP|nr:unnamed protein product [Leptidea sinapis]